MAIQSKFEFDRAETERLIQRRNLESMYRRAVADGWNADQVQRLCDPLESFVRGLEEEVSAYAEQRSHARDRVRTASTSVTRVAVCNVVLTVPLMFVDDPAITRPIGIFVFVTFLLAAICLLWIDASYARRWTISASERRRML